jgi:hypothetical protein
MIALAGLPLLNIWLTPIHLRIQLVALAGVGSTFQPNASAPERVLQSISHALSIMPPLSQVLVSEQSALGVIRGTRA